MKPRLICIFAVLTMLIITIPANGDDYVYLNRDIGNFYSVATNDDISALLINPAGLGFKRRFEGYFSFSTSVKPDNYNDKNIYMLRLPILGAMGYEEYTNGWLGEDRLRVFSWGSAIKLNNFSIGYTYRWYYSDFGTIQKSTNYDLGIMYRPFNWLSFGAVVYNRCERDFLYGKFQTRLRGGAAIRPFTNRITMTWDTEYQQYEKDKFKLLDNYYGLKLEVLPLTYIYARGNKDGDSRFGISFYSGFSSWTFNRVQNEDETVQLDNIAFTFDSLYHKKKFRGLSNRFGPKMVGRISIQGSFTEEDVQGGLFSPRLPKFRDLVSSFEKVLFMDEVGGVVVNLKSNSLSLAQCQEIGTVLDKIQARDKFIIFYLEYGAGMKDYYLASYADAIMMPESASIELLGLSSRINFFKGLFDKVGIQADFIKPDSCIYKSGPEPFTRESLSEPAKENMTSLLGDIFDQLLEGISRNRGISIEQLEDIINNEGIITADKAREMGLIDRIGYDDELKKLVKEYQGMFALPEKFSSINLKMIDFYNDNWSNKAEIAVIYITGSITTGPSGRNLIFGKTAGSETLAKQLTKLAGRKDIKAVVIRVDSPGGSALASDLIWNKIKQLQAKGKKVIISMGNMAASGGYYVACPADKIVADPGTVTGSIGIFGGKFVIGGLFDKVGITQTEIKFGELSDTYSMQKPFSDRERMILKTNMIKFYDQFKERVSDGRSISLEEVEDLARGRVYTGRQALEINLVDELGDLQDAIKIAAREAGIKKINNVIYMDHRGNFMNELFTEGGVRKLIIPDLGLEILNSDHMWYYYPEKIEIK